VSGKIISLEMTAREQLVPGRDAPDPIDLRPVGPGSAELLRSTYLRIGAPHGWTGRTEWSDAQWAEELNRRGVRTWIAYVDDELAGFVELESEPNGDVGIVVFGLVPEFVGRGFGGAFLTLATRLAWSLTSPSGRQPGRVWVQTTSRDHPHAQPNYERRGFRVFRIDLRPTTNGSPS
jgi:RimJ/RimL family protein N-acetyltransferase